MKIRDKESFKKGENFKLEDCHYMIDFYKASIEKHEDWSKFGFKFRPTEEYKDIGEFYKDVQVQGYSIRFANISSQYIDDLVHDGYLYLFQIYNKDFSKHSHGKPNLHTLYFKMLFDEDNLRNVVYKLNGEAEMFYREASINEKEKVVHPANVPIKNKNIDNSKTESSFDYDIIKDKRYTTHQFSLHLPITLNFKAEEQTFINTEVRNALRNSKKNYVVGIDRGERNLLYICVIDEDGKIVEQTSLNEIISDNNYKVNYHKLLDEKEKARDNARKSWGSIENIKELKEGYLSQVVHKICELIVKYDAIVALEDLNFGFKKGRFKVEKQVYQKFENMLITKLNYLIDKNFGPNEPGGLKYAYQLTNKVDGVSKGKQNGIIFYVPAWLTSKIDPVTGFVDLIKPKFHSVADSIAFINKIDDIRFDCDEGMFVFDLDFSKFDRAGTSYRRMWTVYTNGTRIVNKRSKENNSMWESVSINLVDEFKALFVEYGVDYFNNIKEQILDLTDKAFYERFMKLLSQTLQLRNSSIGKVDEDYILSPVKNLDGEFYDSRRAQLQGMPENADANGAYNIARKALWSIEVLKKSLDSEVDKLNLSISNAEWLEYVQK